MAPPDKERCYERKRLRLDSVLHSDPTMVYFATMCTDNRLPVFQNPSMAKAVIESLMWCPDQHWIRIYAYCLMPDHLHIALSPFEGSITLSESLGRFKRFTTSQGWKLGVMGHLWQRGWYDHIARHDEDLLKICQYILENPIRRGLVRRTEEWPYAGLVDLLPF